MKNRKWMVGLLFAAIVFQARTEEKKDLKNLYTTITNAVNTSMLTRRGASEISGSVSFQSMGTEYESGVKINEQSFDADFGYGRFILNNLSLGLVLSIRHQSVENEYLRRTESANQAWAGPFIKKYFGNDRIRPFLSANYLLFRGDAFDGGEAALGAGFLVHLSGNMGMILQATYGVSNARDESIKSRNRLVFGVGLTHFVL